MKTTLQANAHRPLKLIKETVRRLDASQLTLVAGGTAGIDDPCTIGYLQDQAYRNASPSPRGRSAG